MSSESEAERVENLERECAALRELLKQCRASGALLNKTIVTLRQERDALTQELATLIESRSNRVIFLDFDGVINHSGTYARLEREWRGELPGSQLDESEWFEPALVRRVGDLALECGAAIAVISSWLHRHDRAELRRLLLKCGLPPQIFVDSCERGCSKGEAVRRFLDKRIAAGRPVTAYVVIDDGPGELPDRRRLVKTSSTVGFTEDDAKRARRLLLST